MQNLLVTEYFDCLLIYMNNRCVFLVIFSKGLGELHCLYFIAKNINFFPFEKELNYFKLLKVGLYSNCLCVYHLDIN